MLIVFLVLYAAKLSTATVEMIAPLDVNTAWNIIIV